MTVRVIRPGTPPHIQIIDGFCKACGCVFEFAGDDAKLIVGDSRLNFLIKCPTCNRGITVTKPAPAAPVNS